MNVRLDRSVLIELDKTIAEMPAPQPSRPELVRRALAEWLATERTQQSGDAR